MRGRPESAVERPQSAHPATDIPDPGLYCRLLSAVHWAPLLATVLSCWPRSPTGWTVYLARRLNQSFAVRAFLDPVADKLMVASALVLLTADPRVHSMVLDQRLFAIVVLIIIGREITVSALREWMAELGERARGAVSFLGKFKTIGQMVAIPFCCTANHCSACLCFGSVSCFCTGGRTYALVNGDLPARRLAEPDTGRRG